MIDHAQRIAENRRIDDMERKAMPLIVVIVLALAAILIDLSLDTYAAKRHAGEIETARIFAECLNGKDVQIDDNQYVTCSTHNLKLVEGIK